MLETENRRTKRLLPQENTRNYNAPYATVMINKCYFITLPFRGMVRLMFITVQILAVPVFSAF